MFDSTFMLAIVIVVALWVAVTYIERKRDQRNIERIQRRLRKREMTAASRREESD